MFQKRLICSVIVALTSVTSFAAPQNECVRENEHFYNSDFGCTEAVTGLAWSITMPGRYTYEQAARLCVAEDDSRLPSLGEVRRVFGTLKGGANLDVDTTLNYWTSNVGSTTAAQINPSTGARTEAPFSEMGAVMCVRNVHGCSQENQRYKSDAGGCVDTATKLVWSSVWPELDYSAAMTRCENLMQGKKTDWRTPNDKELQSIVSTTEATKFIPGLVQGNWYWSSFRGGEVLQGDREFHWGTPGRGTLRIVWLHLGEGAPVDSLCVRSYSGK